MKIGTLFLVSGVFDGVKYSYFIPPPLRKDAKGENQEARQKRL
jgi:hypothetical protein